MKPIRVLLVDDHPIVRKGIQNLLEKSGDIEVVGEASNGSYAMATIQSSPPDIVLLDMELPDMDGTQLAREIQKVYPEVKILALSAHDDQRYIKGLLELGAAGYLMKEEAPDIIVEAIRGTAQGEKGWVSHRINAQILSWVKPGKWEGNELTSREDEVLRLITQGKTNQAIAADLGISEKTVEKYLGAIYVKLNVSSRVEAAVYAVREGLV
jgi:two-component system, NarL family, response regulator LiaR